MRSTAGWKSSCRSTRRSTSRSATAAYCGTIAAATPPPGRTLDGPHLTDLSVIYADKGIPAAEASTGEQKAILIGLVLAHARLIAAMTGMAPILLLDEIVAHLDPSRRAALHQELAQLGTQVFMTGADPALFAEVGDTAAMFEIRAGQIAPRQPLRARN